MKLKTATTAIILPIVLLGTLLAGLNRLAGPATLRDDLPAIFEMVSDIFEAASAWIFGPPLWQTTVALVVVTVIYVVWLLGDERLLRITLALMRKERFRAELAKAADDTVIIAQREELTAQKERMCAEQLAQNQSMWAMYIVETANWEPVAKPPLLPPLGAPLGPDVDPSMACGPYDVQLSEWRTAMRSRLQSVIDAFAAGDGGLSSVVDDRLETARNRAWADKNKWDAKEQGRYFPNEDSRNAWHELRYMSVEADKILREIRTSLDRKANLLVNSIDEDARSQLLADIVKEMQR